MSAWAGPHAPRAPVTGAVVPSGSLVVAFGPLLKWSGQYRDDVCQNTSAPGYRGCPDRCGIWGSGPELLIYAATSFTAL